ncbi:2-keto-4-pentenoate hydratase [Streptomyces sp. SAI-135]|jgi:2-keto-4-pentenoate hydratase|uniref:2-keto-4-pentenoate hydratase n=1 Tax=unclassified Streptomyces TaxID=2593676 RepID=UPI002476AAA8|nr:MULTISPECIES: fumarylacetoacetate hydrolase family protein [unclassified Streptomyces]MDH6523014.1 2-keto-4-pentenoate hydratase [Streptomyces sp. SAI-090]MDH6554631.1 2-keto-4-pentenoate hydratase [Streptomyces sp. SAI-041]MDH6573897.1 2-keto-4-pentenoate hydratase [Streptomyces sp. SAI-117]MDH6581367.1 2-keto-4-pentenoate hydratase [Streptomyces sp. SAI-133]MDH6613373.1 2-keto-4-pentenoate hydratase [Streptomyces sp. SAI-135]
MSGTTPSVSASSPTVRKVADLLADAAASGKPCPPVRSLIAAGDIGTAYAVQRLNTERRLTEGHRLVGRKIGLTSEAVQRQLGVDQPDFGALLSDMTVPQDGQVPFGRLLQPKVEAEVALVLNADVPNADCTIDDVIAATEYAVPALEIVDSRIADWDITFVDTVADNASSGLYVLGEQRVRLDDVDLVAVSMSMSKNGGVASEGTGAACLGSPLNAALWLARTLAELGDPLKAGDVLLTGALGPMVAATPGDVFAASISQLGNVSVRFAPEPAGEGGNDER